METQSQIVHRKRIGELLIEAGLLNSEQLPIGLQEAQERSLKLGEVLVMLRYLSAEDLESVLQAQTKLEDGSISDTEAVSALKFASKNNISFEEARQKLRQAEDEEKAAEYQRELEKLDEQLRSAERFGNNREVGAICMQLGDFYSKHDKFTEAETNYKRALQILERSFGQKHLRVAACQSRLADLYFNRGRYNDAETLYWRVLDITQSAWSSEHPDVAACHKSLARLLEAQGRLKEAEQFYLSSLRILEKVAGPDSPEYTDGLRKLAAFWRKQGRKPEHKRLGDLLLEAGMLAQDQLQIALEYCQKAGCPLGQALVNLEYIVPDELRPALQAQLLIGDGVLPTQIATRALKLTHDGKAFIDALRQLGWEPDRFTTHELALLIATAEELFNAEASLGSEHASVGILSLKLAEIHFASKRVAEAEPLYKRAVAILEKAFGPKNLELSLALTKLGRVYLEENRLLDAEKVLWRALEIRQSQHGQNHLEVSDCLDLLAIVQEKQSNPEQAERLYQSSIAIQETLLGRSHARTAPTLDRMALCLHSQSKLSEAEEIYLRLIKALERDNHCTHKHLTAVLERLGELYVDMKEYAKAATQFELALEIYERENDVSDSAAALMEKFAFLLETTGRMEESRKMVERAQIVKRMRT